MAVYQPPDVLSTNGLGHLGISRTLHHETTPRFHILNDYLCKNMPQSRGCAVCKSPKRQAIDKALIEGCASLAEIAKQYGIKYNSVDHHLQRHIKPAIATAEKTYDSRLRDTLVDYVESLSARMERLQRVTDEVLHEAHVDGYPVFDKNTGEPKLNKDQTPARRKSPKMTLWAVDQSRKNVETSLKAVESIAKLTGKLQPEAAAPVSFTFEHLQVLYLGLKEQGAIT